jgi:hypothetical protein
VIEEAKARYGAVGKYNQKVCNDKKTNNILIICAFVGVKININLCLCCLARTEVMDYCTRCF